MKTFKQIVYRNEDTVLMIVPSVEELITPRFVNTFTGSQKTTFANLINFCSTKVSQISYIVYTTDVDKIDIQPTEGEVVSLVVSELGIGDKFIVDSVLQECTNLLNN